MTQELTEDLVMFFIVCLCLAVYKYVDDMD